jgi:tetratricopeptide (TPR) repeat protein
MDGERDRDSIRVALGKRPFAKLGRFVDEPGHWTYRTWALFLDWCEQVRRDTPRRAVTAAASAVRLGDRVLTAQGGEKNDAFRHLRVRTWAVLGSAYRVQGLLRQAEGALCVAMSVRCRDVVLYGELCRRMMSLRMDQRRFKEAEFFVTAALGVFRRAGRSHLAGCALTDRGVLRANAGQISLANADFRNAVPQIDASRDTVSLGAAVHNLATGLTLDGEADEREILTLFRRARRLVKSPKESLPGVKLLWLKGKVHRRIGDLGTAEEALGTAAFRVAKLDLPREAALVALDLVELYSEQERHDEARQVAREALRFSAARLDKAASAALELLCDATCERRLTPDLVASTGEALGGLAMLIHENG